MPYNQLNLDNYIDILRKRFGLPIIENNTSSECPIKLMSGQHANAKIISTMSTGAQKRKIIIIGKGILFDAGGYNLKREMSDMKCDMAGMATAISVASYFLKEHPYKKYNVQAVCPVATNFIHNNEIIPGDRIKIGNKIVEITNTDAEGRLILAEALSNIKIGKNDIVITVATLTGIVGYAVGSKATGVFGVNDELVNKYIDASKKAKELAWRLPLWDYLQKDFEKKLIKNSVKTKPGASLAAMFVKQFVKYPKNWLHLDIAYSSYNEFTYKPTGDPIKTLIEFIKGLK